MKKIILHLTAAIAFVACNSMNEDIFPAKKKANVAPQKVEQQAQNNNVFAWELYQKLISESPDKNIFYSPYSISTALAMTYAGAKKNTAQEMQRTLHFLQDAPHPAFSGLIDQIQMKNSDYQLSVANALWGQKNTSFLPEFLNTTGNYYGAGLHEVDFLSEKEKARQTINRWVAKNTEDKIQELFPPNSLSEQTRLVLTNAIYFKGSWLHAFEASATAQDVFYTSADAKVNVDMMTQKQRFPYYEEQDLQVVQLPYRGEDLKMLILLPKHLESLDSSISEQKLQKILSEMRSTKVWVKMPKFKTRYRLDAKSVLQNMGIKDAFSRAADFSGINGKQNLYIAKVVHEAFVNIDEEGTEAAASTGVAVNVKSAARPPLKFFVNRPFLFTIIHSKTNSTLFIGRIIDPNK